MDWQTVNQGVIIWAGANLLILAVFGYRAWRRR